MRDVYLVSTTQQHKHQKSFKRGSHEIIKMNMGKMGKACMLTCFSPLQHVSDLSLLMLDMLAWPEVVGQWARKEVYPTEKVDITKPQAVPQGPTRVQPGSNISGASLAGPRRKQHQPPLHQRVEGQLNDSKDSKGILRVSLNVESFGMTLMTMCDSVFLGFARTLFQFMPSMSPPMRTLLRRVSASP